MIKEISKFNNELYTTYLQVLKKEIEHKIETSLSMTSKEISAFVEEKLSIIKKNGGLLFTVDLFDTEFSRLSSVRYNAIMSALKLDIDALITNLVSIIDLTGVAEYVVQHDFQDIIFFANEQASRIRNLKLLLDTNKEFNGYLTTTLNEDDNTYDNEDYRALHRDGLYKIKPFLVDDVATNENHAEIITTVMNDNINIIKNEGDIFSVNMLDGFITSMFSTVRVGYNGTIKGEYIVYDGLILAYRIKLPDIRQINSLSFKYFSTDNLDIIKLLYSSIDITSLESEQWQEVTDLTTDELNFGSKELNFQTVFAKEVVLIIGQKFVMQTEISIDTNIMNRYIYDYDITSKVENSISAMSSMNAISENSQLNIVKRDKTLYSLPSSSNNMDIKLKKMFQEFIDSIYGSQKRLNDFSGFMYYINIFDLKLYRNLYKQLSVYESKVITSPGTLVSARISKQDKLPSGSWINYYIMYNDKKVRTIRKGDYVKDIFVVDQPDKTVFSTDFLIDTNADVIVYKNNAEYEDYEFNGLLNNIATGITLNAIPKFGDIFVIEYQVPESDQFGNAYDPWNVNVIDIDGYPNIKHSSLLNIQNESRVLIKTSGSVCCYPISTNLIYDSTDPEKKIFYIDKSFVYAPQLNDIISMQNPTDPEGNFYLYDMESGITPSGTFYKIPQRLEVSGISGIQIDELVNDTRKDVYYGVLDELVTLNNDNYIDYNAREYGESGTDNELTQPSDDYSTVENFIPAAAGGTFITFSLGSGSTRRSWNIATSGSVGTSGVWTSGTTSSGTIFGTAQFMANTGSWSSFASPLHDGVKDIYLPRTGNGTTNGGKISYRYISYAWRKAFDASMGGVSGGRIVIAVNGSVYLGSVDPLNLVNTFDGRVGPAAGGYATDSLQHLDPSGTQPQEFVTTYPYIPGTLVCTINDIRVPIREYDSTIPEGNPRKDVFTVNTYGVPSNAVLKISYVPIDVNVNSACESNIMDFNEYARFDNTDNNGTVTLIFSPYVDVGIMSQSIGQSKIWYVNKNTYALKDNVSVTYKPMEVRIDGILATDITDYINSEVPIFTAYDVNRKNYEYYISGKTVYFNTFIIGSIEIKYYKLNDRIKLRAELYRFNMKRYDITPEIHDIMILTNTI